MGGGGYARVSQVAFSERAKEMMGGLTRSQKFMETSRTDVCGKMKSLEVSACSTGQGSESPGAGRHLEQAQLQPKQERISVQLPACPRLVAAVPAVAAVIVLWGPCSDPVPR